MVGSLHPQSNPTMTRLVQGVDHSKHLLSIRLGHQLWSGIHHKTRHTYQTYPGRCEKPLSKIGNCKPKLFKWSQVKSVYYFHQIPLNFMWRIPNLQTLDATNLNNSREHSQPSHSLLSPSPSQIPAPSQHPYSHSNFAPTAFSPHPSMSDSPSGQPGNQPSLSSQYLPSYDEAVDMN